MTLYIYLGLYVTLLIGMSYVLNRRETSEGFLIAERNRTWWAISLSKFVGSIGVGYFVSYTGYAYEYGLGVYLLLIGALVGYTSFGLWASPRLYAHSREERFYTQGDFVAHITGNNAAKSLTNALSSIILFGWLMVGIIGGAKVISHFGLIPYELALIATVLITTVYILLAGFRAVLATDVLQAIVVFILMILLTWVIVHDISLGNILSAQTGTVDTATAVGFFIFGSLSIYSYANFYQLVYAAKSKSHAIIGIATSILPVIAVASLLLMIGMYMSLQNPELNSGLVFLEALAVHLPTSMLPIGIVLFFAGLMSSADTNIYSITSHYVLTHKPSNPVRNIRIATIMLGSISIVIGYFFRDVVDMTLFAAAMSVVLSAPMIYLIAGGKNTYRFIGSIIGGLSGLTTGIFIMGLEPSLILPVLLGSLIGLAYNGFGVRGDVV